MRALAVADAARQQSSAACACARLAKARPLERPGLEAAMKSAHACHWSAGDGAGLKFTRIPGRIHHSAGALACPGWPGWSLAPGRAVVPALMRTGSARRCATPCAFAPAHSHCLGVRRRAAPASSRLLMTGRPMPRWGRSPPLRLPVRIASKRKQPDSGGIAWRGPGFFPAPVGGRAVQVALALWGIAWRGPLPLRRMGASGACPNSSD